MNNAPAELTDPVCNLNSLPKKRL